MAVHGTHDAYLVTYLAEAKSALSFCYALTRDGLITLAEDIADNREGLTELLTTGATMLDDDMIQFFSNSYGAALHDMTRADGEILYAAKQYWSEENNLVSTTYESYQYNKLANGLYGYHRLIFDGDDELVDMVCVVKGSFRRERDLTAEAVAEDRMKRRALRLKHMQRNFLPSCPSRDKQLETIQDFFAEVTPGWHFLPVPR